MEEWRSHFIQMLEGKEKGGEEKKAKEQEDRQREEGIGRGLTEEMDVDLDIKEEGICQTVKRMKKGKAA